ncbi:TPA: hypothetical protein DDW35_09635, partial [Candidatus Sumerlaeota bacterium]|nr:hypothetical protein [Candidatus Sumerlaeota bacterium]
KISADKVLRDFQMLKINGVVLHKDYMRPENTEDMTHFYEETLKLKKFFEGEGILVFEKP